MIKKSKRNRCKICNMEIEPVDNVLRGGLCNNCFIYRIKELKKGNKNGIK